MTVAAIGFVNAGLLSFTSALWVVFGSNFGSTVTGWLVAWLGFKLKIDAFALPLIGIGMALKLTGEGSRRGALGMAMAGFGLLFLGIDMLKQGFEGLGPQALPSLSGDAAGVALSVLVGVLLMLPLSATLVRFLLARFRSADEYAARPRYLGRNVAAVPVLALQALRHELARMGSLALALARNATPAHAQGDVRLALQLGTVEHLQRAIGAFVSEVSRQQMHRDVSAQLPELLRIATHFDTLARVMHHIGQQRPVPATHPGIENVMQPVFDAARAFFEAADPESANAPAQAGGPWLALEARDAFEDAYQIAKAALPELSTLSHGAPTRPAAESDSGRSVESAE